jgi:hypothetical protein
MLHFINIPFEILLKSPIYLGVEVNVRVCLNTFL